MTILFFVPLSLIALYESTRTRPKNGWLKHWLHSTEEGETVVRSYRDPEVQEGEGAERRVISKVKFDELVKHFPKTEQVRIAHSKHCTNEAKIDGSRARRRS
jgi:hypothetical protein